VSILALLFKAQLRGYRKLLKKGWPLVGALLVFILLVADGARMVTGQVLSSACLPLIYGVVFLFIAGRRILFLKYPPFYFSLPGLYFFLTTPVNHRLVLAGKILLSYLPLLLLSFGWSILARPAPAGLPDGAGLFFTLVAVANISWLLYNAAANRLLLRKILIFLAIMFMLFIKTPGFVWALIAAGSYGWALYSADGINWSKFENHCRVAYLTRKYLLAGNWGGLEALAYEYAQPPAASFFAARVYATGRWAFPSGQTLLISRYPLLGWVMFLGQSALSIFLMGKGGYLSVFGGSLLLVLGFVAPFALPVQKLKQKMGQGLFPAGDFPDFLTGMLIIPTVVAWVLLTVVVFCVSSGFNPIGAIAAAFFPAVILSYLAVVKGMSGPALSGWFVSGALLFALLFSLLCSAFWGEAFAVLLFFIPYLGLTCRWMRGIYEG